MNLIYRVGDETMTLHIEKSGAGFAVTIGERTFTVDAASLREGELSFTLDGARHTAHVATDGARRWVAMNGQTVVLDVPQAEKKTRRGQAAGPKHDSLEAQMPGVVRKVLVAAGDRVEKGQPLLVMEAMKMEIKIAAPHAGTVERVAVREGETVQRGQLLVEIVE
ncbi:MAG: biotin/lipoyl-containing protein [Anaerolineales bacterium]